ncbi:hypothetical protein Clacol_010190 [Clathrus columnatus]|uniref:Uncharacterized protein n=1 Tax=Clathrus columnatus TaxID=1419009 RepID=A0AAV5AQ73_9AGAM|nr:hypothetical protein Clacol_010190 [Clathrus columnatus]
MNNTSVQHDNEYVPPPPVDTPQLTTPTTSGTSELERDFEEYMRNMDMFFMTGNFSYTGLLFPLPTSDVAYLEASNQEGERAPAVEPTSEVPHGNSPVGQCDVQHSSQAPIDSTEGDLNTSNVLNISEENHIEYGFDVTQPSLSQFVNAEAMSSEAYTYNNNSTDQWQEYAFDVGSTTEVPQEYPVQQHDIPEQLDATNSLYDNHTQSGISTSNVPQEYTTQQSQLVNSQGISPEASTFNYSMYQWQEQIPDVGSTFGVPQEYPVQQQDVGYPMYNTQEALDTSSNLINVSQHNDTESGMPTYDIPQDYETQQSQLELGNSQVMSQKGFDQSVDQWQDHTDIGQTTQVPHGYPTGQYDIGYPSRPMYDTQGKFNAFNPHNPSPQHAPDAAATSRIPRGYPEEQHKIGYPPSRPMYTPGELNA